MAVTLNKLYVKTFERIVRHLAQQTDSRFRPWVMERNEPGSTRNWPRMGLQAFGQKVGTRVATPAGQAQGQAGMDSIWSNRVTTVATYHGADTTEQEDINQLLIDPNSNIAQSLGAAARRQVDDLIIASATGNALDEAGGTPAFPAAQILGDYTTEIDFSAATAALELFLKNDIPPEEPKVFGVASKQARKLLHIAQATQSFYVGQALALIGRGFVKEWLGFDWILSNRLLAPVAGQRTCLAFTRKAIGLHVSKDIWARVAEDPSISFAWRIYAALSMGAIRVEDEHIVQVQLADTCTVVG